MKLGDALREFFRSLGQATRHEPMTAIVITWFWAAIVFAPTILFLTFSSKDDVENKPGKVYVWFFMFYVVVYVLTMVIKWT